MLVALAGYVLLKALYNLVFVGIWHQGHWYFPLSILTLNLLAADALAPLLRRFTTPGPLRSALPVLCFAWIWVAGTAFAAARSIHPVHGRSFAFFSGRVAIEAELERRCPGCGVVSFDDGVVAFSLDRPVLNGLGLVLDREAFDARRDGRLLELARERGFELLTTVNYPFATELDSASLRHVLARYPHLRDEPLDRFDFEIVWREPESGAVFVRFSPGEPARAGSAPPSEASRPRGA